MSKSNLFQNSFLLLTIIIHITSSIVNTGSLTGTLCKVFSYLSNPIMWVMVFNVKFAGLLQFIMIKPLDNTFQKQLSENHSHQYQFL